MMKIKMRKWVMLASRVTIDMACRGRRDES